MVTKASRRKGKGMITKVGRGATYDDVITIWDAHRRDNRKSYAYVIIGDQECCGGARQLGNLMSNGAI
jgi:hypothetical protein